MAIQYLSSGAKSGHDEDHIGVFSTAGLLDVLVIDGRTSVADQDYIDPVHGEVAWFVQSFAAALGEIAASGRSQQDSVHAAIGVVRIAYELAAEGHAPVRLSISRKQFCGPKSPGCAPRVSMIHRAPGADAAAAACAA